MTFYRLFVIDEHGRIATVAREVHSTSDEGACAQAAALVGQVSFELWDRARLVASVEHGVRIPGPAEIQPVLPGEGPG